MQMNHVFSNLIILNSKKLSFLLFENIDWSNFFNVVIFENQHLAHIILLASKIKMKKVITNVRLITILNKK